MQAIVLAAGKGKRLKNLTSRLPKPMLGIKGEVVLEHNLKWLKKFGNRDIYINLHYLPEVIEDYFTDGSRVGVNIKYSCEKEILGTAGGVKKIIEDYGWNKWDDDFLVIYGDNFYPATYNLSDFVDFHLQKASLVTLGLYKCEEEIYKSGVVLLGEDDLVNAFVEKPNPHQIDPDFLRHGLINAGIYGLKKKVLDFIPDGFSDFGRDVFPKLIADHIQMSGYVFEEPLIAIDTVELYKKVKRDS